MVNPLFLGGIMNIVDPVIRVQLYVWMWLGFVILALLIHVGYKYGTWKNYAPLHGLYHAKKAGSNSAFIFDINLHGEMVEEKVAKCIFDYSKEGYEIEVPVIPVIGRLVHWFYVKIAYYPTAYLDNIDPLTAIVYKFGGVNQDVQIARSLEGGDWERAPSVTCGGVDVDIIIDSGNWTIRNTPEHRAVEKHARLWNSEHPTDQIHSYMKFQRYLLNNNIIAPELKADIVIPWVRTQTGLPLDLEESDWAGKRRQMAEQEYNADLIMKNKFAVWILIGGLGLSFFVIAVRLITHFF